MREVVINKETLGSGSVWDVGFSTDPAQAFLYINDGTNQLIYVLDRQTLEVVSTFGGAGHWAGQFYGAHVLAVNSKGDLVHRRDVRRESGCRNSPTRASVRLQLGRSESVYLKAGEELLISY